MNLLRELVNVRDPVVPLVVLITTENVPVPALALPVVPVPQFVERTPTLPTPLPLLVETVPTETATLEILEILAVKEETTVIVNLSTRLAKP